MSPSASATGLGRGSLPVSIGSVDVLLLDLRLVVWVTGSTHAVFHVRGSRRGHPEKRVISKPKRVRVGGPLARGVDAGTAGGPGGGAAVTLPCMRRVNIQAAFLGEGGDSDTGDEEGLALAVRGGEVVLVLPAGTSEDRAVQSASTLRGSLRLESGRVLTFEIHDGEVGAF